MSWGTADKTPAKQRLSDEQKLARDTLAEWMAKVGMPAPASLKLKVDARIVSVDDWRAELFNNGVLDRDAPNPRQPFIRLKDGLKIKNTIGEKDGYLWLTSAKDQA